MPLNWASNDATASVAITSDVKIYSGHTILNVQCSTNVGGGLPPIAVCQSLDELTVPLPSGASPLPHLTEYILQAYCAAA